MSQKPKKVSEHLQEKMKDPHFRESYAVELIKAQISKEIIQVRMEEKLSQQELADKIGITQQEISKIENGEFEQIKTVVRVLMALKHRATVSLPPKEVPLEA